VVVRRDVQAADLADDPVVGQLLRPAGVGDKARDLRGRRHAVNAAALRQPLEDAGLRKRSRIRLRSLSVPRLGNNAEDERANNGKHSQSHLLLPFN
jgi:hypothetical protein